MSTQEKWINIRYYKGYTFDGKYEVSSWGNIRNAETKKPLATYSNQRGKGYKKTKIVDEQGVRRAIYIHQLVAFYFLEQRPQEGEEIDHIDGNSQNNSYTNLRYVTHKENCHAMRIAIKAAEEKTYCKYCGRETNGAYCCRSCYQDFEEDRYEEYEGEEDGD